MGSRKQQSLAEHATELVHLNVDMIVTSTGTAALAAKRPRKPSPS